MIRIINKKKTLSVIILILMSMIVGCSRFNEAVNDEGKTKDSGTAVDSSKTSENSSNQQPHTSKPTDAPINQKPQDSKATDDPVIQEPQTSTSNDAPIIQKPGIDDEKPKPDYLNKKVYFTKYSELFHFDPECPAIKDKSSVTSATLREAITLGHTVPCKICIPQY